MSKRMRLLLSLFAITALAVGVAGCGDDDGDDAAAEDDGGEATEDDSATDDAAEDDGGDEEAAACAEGDTFLFPPSGEPTADALPVTIAATDYAFSDNAADIPGVGSYAVTFQNEGEEIHELIVSRINDDETRSVPELLAGIAGGENPEDLSTTVAATSACPGESTIVAVDIESAGRYVLVCNLPVGAVPGSTEADFEELTGSHAEQGMVVEAIVA
jgi:hypothetical protein